MDKAIFAKIIGSISELIALVVALTYGGKWLDHRFNFDGYFMMAGGFLAMLIWGYHLIVIFKDPAAK